MDELDTNRKQRLRTLKNQIREGYETFYTTGMALIEIRETTLFLEDEDNNGDNYTTFEAFVKGEFDMSARHAYRLIDAAKTRRLLPPPPRTNEWNEGTIRSLTKLNHKVAERVSRIAVQKVEKSYQEAEKDPTIKRLRLTAALINQTIREDEHREPPKPKPKTDQMMIEQEAERIAARIEGIVELIGKFPEDFWQSLKKDKATAEKWKRLRVAIARLDEVTK